MALKVTTQQEYKYTPYSERDTEKPFSVTFKLLGAQQLAKLDDNLIMVVQDEGMSVKRGTYSYKAVKAALVSWENVEGDKGDITLSKNTKGEVEDSSLSLIPSNLLEEIANVIIACSKNPSNSAVYLGAIEDVE